MNQTNQLINVWNIDNKIHSISKKELETILLETHDKSLTLYPELWDKDNPVEFKCVIRTISVERIIDSFIATQKLVIDKDYLKFRGNKYRLMEGGNGSVMHYFNFLNMVEWHEEKFDLAEKTLPECWTIIWGNVSKREKKDIDLKTDYLYGILADAAVQNKVAILSEKIQKKVANILNMSLESLCDFLVNGGRVKVRSV